MRCHVLQHVPFEGPGHLNAWAQQRGHELLLVPLHAGASLPDVAEVEAAIVLGGPMGVHDVDAVPFLRAEKTWLRGVLDADRPLLGVCLGAQLIADALGARVHRHTHREIGWWPVVRTEHGRSHPLTRHLVDGIAPLHWHGDTFDLPPGATRLLSSAGCAEQAFVVGRRVVGLQLHLEVTADGVRDLLRACPEDLAPGPWTQSAEAIAALQPAHALALHASLDALLDAWLDAR